MTQLRQRGYTIGFVPTMGALHEGHLSLIRRARKENRVVAVSIFVNPLQFGPHEDFTHYPRNLMCDRSLLAKEKVDYLFIPHPSGLYPKGFQTLVEVPSLARPLCGRFRPGHFRGVATVVAKLFNLAKPHRAYFGSKDYQQAVIVQRLAWDLNFDVKIRILPAVRDSDGLALSSRNTYLSPVQRKRALAIPRSLTWAKVEIQRGNRDIQYLRRGILFRLRSHLDRIDYVEFLEPKTLQAVRSIQSPLLIAIAGWVGKTRLIDNAIIKIQKQKGKS